MPEQPPQPKRALIEYRTKPFEENAKWSLYFQRVIDSAVDTSDALKQFYGSPLWPALTGMIEVRKVSWLD